MTEGSQVDVCCPKIFSSIAYNWMEYHLLSIGVLCMRPRSARSTSHILRHLHVFVKIRTIHETRCLWSVFKFIWFEDFNFPDVSVTNKMYFAVSDQPQVICPGEPAIVL